MRDYIIMTIHAFLTHPYYDLNILVRWDDTRLARATANNTATSASVSLVGVRAVVKDSVFPRPPGNIYPAGTIHPADPKLMVADPKAYSCGACGCKGWGKALCPCGFSLIDGVLRSPTAEEAYRRMMMEHKKKDKGRERSPSVGRRDREQDRKRRRSTSMHKGNGYGRGR